MLAQRNKAQDFGDTVNETVVQRKFTLLNRVPSGKFNKVNALIWENLSLMWGVSLFSEMFCWG